MDNLFAPIGITGLKRSGKDTVAHMIEKHHVRTCHIEGFAEPIRDISRQFGFTDFEISEDKTAINELWGISWREFAQMFGTELMRNGFREDVWTTLMEWKIRNRPSKITIIPDVRFENEAQIIKDMGGHIIWVCNPNTNTQEPDTHASEAGISIKYIDSVIINDGNLTELEMATVKLMRKFDWYKPSHSFEKLIKACTTCLNCGRNKTKESENDKK